MSTVFSPYFNFIINDLPHLRKSLIFNFRYFDFKTAIKMPVWVSKNVIFFKKEGRVEIPKHASFKMIKIGFGHVPVFDKKTQKTIWSVAGEVHFQGKADIGHGSKIHVGKQGYLRFGVDFVITAESEILCEKKIVFGDRCLVSWDNIFMDTDYHQVYNIQNQLENPDKEIVIGANNWIGMRCSILKGTKTNDNTVIAAQSLLNKEYIDKNVILGGNPAKVIKRNIVR